MKKFFKKLILQWDKFWYTRTLKDDLVYVNRKRNIYLHVDSEEGLMKIFISGLIFRMPLNIDIKNEEDIENILDEVEDMNLENTFTEDLKEMLLFYEEKSDYEKCARIRDILNNRNNHEQTNKSSSNI